MGLKETHKARIHTDSADSASNDGNYYVYNDTEQPINGYVYENFKTSDNANSSLNGPNGLPIVYEVEYREGFRVGWRRTYYPNGKVKQEVLDYYDLPILYKFYNEQGQITKKWFTSDEPGCRQFIKDHNMIDGELDY